MWIDMGTRDKGMQHKVQDLDDLNVPDELRSNTNILNDFSVLGEVNALRRLKFCMISIS